MLPWLGQGRHQRALTDGQVGGLGGLGQEGERGTPGERDYELEERRCGPEESGGKGGEGN